MKIVFISEDNFLDSFGGLEQHIFYLSKELVKKKCKIYIISLQTNTKDSYSKKKIKINGQKSNIWLIKIKKKNLLHKFLNNLKKTYKNKFVILLELVLKLLPNLYYQLIISEVNKINPQIIHQHDYLSSIIASKMLSKYKKVIFTNHTGQYLYLEKNFLSRLLQKYLIRHFKYIIAPSIELKPKTKNSKFISNGVDTNFFNGKKKKNNKKIIFLCARRWAPTKGIIYLAKAISKLDKNVLDKCLFLFAGNKSDDYISYKKQILKILKEIPKKNYKLLGNLSHRMLKKFYLLADASILPSVMEATSLSALESMSCGTPVLSTNVGGMPSIIKNNSTGWLIESKNPIILKKKIEELVYKRSSFSKIGKNSKKIVHKKYSWSKISNEVFKIYKNIKNEK